MTTPMRYPILRAGLIASFVASLIFTAFWTYEQNRYFGYGPRDVPGWEGWSNLAMEVALPAFIVTLLHAVPPWLLLSLAALLWRIGRPATRSENLGVMVVAYICLAGATAWGWYVFTIGLTLGIDAPVVWEALLVYCITTFLPGVLLAAWWVLRKAIARRAPARA